MHNQKPAPVYGITKAEYARQLQEQEKRHAQPSVGIFTRLRKRFQ